MPGSTPSQPSETIEHAPEPSLNGDSPQSPITTQSPSRSRLWISIGVAAVLVAVALVILLTAGGKPASAPAPTGSGGLPISSPGAPARTPLVLKLKGSSPMSVTGKDGQQAASNAGNAIRSRLSAFYDATLADPSSWRSGPPAATWDVFAGAIRATAQKDANAFTLGKAGAQIQRLTFTAATVRVQVLLDNKGKVAAAEADVTIDATGATQAGPADVAARASFLLSFEDGRWMITGYPNASVDVSPASPSTAEPTPSPSGSTP